MSKKYIGIEIQVYRKEKSFLVRVAGKTTNREVAFQVGKKESLSFGHGRKVDALPIIGQENLYVLDSDLQDDLLQTA